MSTEGNPTPETFASNRVRGCSCGCGRPVANPSARFLQGHDASLVSKAINSLFDNTDYLGILAANGVGVSYPLEARAATLQSTIQRMFGSPLAYKFQNAFLTRKAKVATRQTRQAAKTAKPEPVADGETIKVGRWEYPTAKVAGSGVIYRNTKRDGSGTWEEVA